MLCFQLEAAKVKGREPEAAMSPEKTRALEALRTYLESLNPKAKDPLAFAKGLAPGQKGAAEDVRRGEALVKALEAAVESYARNASLITYEGKDTIKARSILETEAKKAQSIKQRKQN